MNRPIPAGQTIADIADRCRYAGPRGCRLDRLDRPWVCTWYLCPTQRSRLRAEGPAVDERLQRKVKEIGSVRKKLLEVFLRQETEDGTDGP